MFLFVIMVLVFDSICEWIEFSKWLLNKWKNIDSVGVRGLVVFFSGGEKVIGKN